MLEVGDAVVFHDTFGAPHNAILTAIFGSGVDADNKVFYDDTGCTNVVYVSGSDAEQDAYGRQTKRESSVPHVSKTTVHGRYWRKADEEPRPTSTRAKS